MLRDDSILELLRMPREAVEISTGRADLLDCAVARSNGPVKFLLARLRPSRRPRDLHRPQREIRLTIVQSLRTHKSPVRVLSMRMIVSCGFAT